MLLMETEGKIEREFILTRRKKRDKWGVFVDKNLSME